MKKISLYLLCLLALGYAIAAYAGRDVTNKFTLGDGAASNKTWMAKRSSGATNPYFGWVESANKWQFSNDGVALNDFGGTGGLNVSGSSGTPNNITAGGGITFTAGQQRMLQFIQGSGGNVDVTANPQIQAGTIVGQELKLIGRNDSQRVLLEDGTGLSLVSSYNMGANDELSLIWNGSVWVESNNGKREKHVRILVSSVCGSDPCTIAAQDGDRGAAVTSVNKETGTARYSVTFPAKTWASSTSWHCSVTDQDNLAGWCSGDVIYTGTKWEFACYATGGSGQDSNFSILCSGI